MDSLLLKVMTISYLDIVFALIAIGISSVTAIHWSFTLAVSILLSKAVETAIEKFISKQLNSLALR